jgi:hypothetical protein
MSSSQRDSMIVARHEVPRPEAEGAREVSTRFQHLGAAAQSDSPS